MGELKKKKHNYLFGNFLGNAMARVDMRTQLEASLMSMSLMICGMIITTFYLAFYYHPPLWYKITLVINLIAAMIFMTSFLTTTFQQYNSYLEAVEFQEELRKLKGGQTKDAEKNTTEITANA